MIKLLKTEMIALLRRTKPYGVNHYYSSNQICILAHYISDLSSAHYIGFSLMRSFISSHRLFGTLKLEWYHWFQATKRGSEAVRKDPIGFSRIMWDNWSPKGWYDEATFQATAKSWLNKDWAEVTLHSYRARWDEAQPDVKSFFLEQKVKKTKTLSHPAIYIQGELDGVNPSIASENVQQKFSGPFQRIVMPGVGHFPSREAPDALAQHLLEFLQPGQ